MIKRLLLHNITHYLFRFLFLIPLVALFLIQNYEEISILNTYGIKWLSPAKMQYSSYLLIPNLSSESIKGVYNILNADNLADLYHKIKYNFDIVFQYESYSSNEEILVMDIDYYKSKYDQSFSTTSVPCVLEAPQGYKGKDGSRLGSKCGTNEHVRSNYSGNWIIDFERTSVVLIDGYLEPKTSGNEMVLYPNRDTANILISNSYTDDQKQNILNDIQSTFENFYNALGLDGTVLILDQSVSAYKVLRLLKDAWHFSSANSIPIFLLAIAGIFELVNLLFKTNRDYIVICTLVSKKKWKIFSPLYLSCLIIDIIAILISIFLFTSLTDIPIKEAPFIGIILTIFLILIETIIFLIMSRIYRGNKLAMDIRAKESD